MNEIREYLIDEVKEVGIVNIIMKMKSEMEHKDKFQKCLDQIGNFYYKIVKSNLKIGNNIYVLNKSNRFCYYPVSYMYFNIHNHSCLIIENDITIRMINYQ